ncbi:MAG TPA: DoxX family protein [Cellulomonadaceae bacterium]|nr:DoxX family protein [Cellulomonadaceae bacterium]
MLLRKIARPMLSSWFVLEGVDVVRDPMPHAELASAALAPVLDRIPTTSTLARFRSPSPREWVALTRIHGAATAGAALMLASGRCPRGSALALAALTAPAAAANLPFPFLAEADTASAPERRRRLVTLVSLVGAAVLAGIDTEGRPGIGWRLAHARDGRETHASR